MLGWQRAMDAGLVSTCLDDFVIGAVDSLQCVLHHHHPTIIVAVCCIGRCQSGRGTLREKHPASMRSTTTTTTSSAAITIANRKGLKDVAEAALGNLPAHFHLHPIIER